MRRMGKGKSALTSTKWSVGLAGHTAFVSSSPNSMCPRKNRIGRFCYEIVRNSSSVGQAERHDDKQCSAPRTDTQRIRWGLTRNRRRRPPRKGCLLRRASPEFNIILICTTCLNNKL